MGSSGSKNDRLALLAPPTMPCTSQAPLFNGLLYRLTDERDGTIGFFNNSKDYEFQISYLFTSDSMIEPLDKTAVMEQDDGILCEVVVYPLESQRFVRGSVVGFESKIEAVPLSEEYFRLHKDLNGKKYFRRLGPFPSQSF
ncbi:calpain like cysteine peptidase Clan CA family C2 [Trypanosoma vivax]|uniref:Putative calpain-like protein n=1 Tax=Trypanosoma vivax (strain Y486) TaxID=1055687 RepID=G0TR88_TRYVY|nr:putative calpain-like protein [Trypanosoma vivax]KAH8612479.1 calpain like cysteine peptidase Clan CA family C2 [Trypanosoma vivax]CCC46452.1 putative calpain-like protein fragment [Trypanosoma vivax Y486]